MKIFAICGSENLQTGLRLAGIEGTLVQNAADFPQAYAEAAAMQDVGIIAVSRSFAAQIKERPATPLIVEIGD